MTLKLFCNSLHIVKPNFNASQSKKNEGTQKDLV